MSGGRVNIESPGESKMLKKTLFNAHAMETTSDIRTGGRLTSVRSDRSPVYEKGSNLHVLATGLN